MTQTKKNNPTDYFTGATLYGAGALASTAIMAAAHGCSARDIPAKPVLQPASQSRPADETPVQRDSTLGRIRRGVRDNETLIVNAGEVAATLAALGAAGYAGIKGKKVMARTGGFSARRKEERANEGDEISI